MYDPPAMNKIISKLLVLFLLVLVQQQSRASVQVMNICNNRLVRLEIHVTSGVAQSFLWSLGGGSYAGTLTDSFVNGVAYATPGSYLATCKITYTTGNTAIDSFLIVSVDRKVQNIPLKDTVICGSVKLTLDAGNSTQPLARYLWSPGGEITRTKTINTPGTYSVSVYTADQYSYNFSLCSNCFACDSQSKTVTVTQGAAATVDLGPDRFICNDNPITLDAGSGMSSYLWSPGNEITQTITVNIGGTYSVTIVNSDKCVGTDMVTFKDSCPMLIFVPNAFTPDVNGNNDIFIWKGNMKMKTYHLKIYNRWGQKMFETSDPAQGWDGIYNGKNAIPGVYCYLLDCVDGNEVRHVMKGNITLLE